MEKPVFPEGYVFTTYSNLHLTVVGQASGGQGVVVWGPNAATGQWEALKMVRPDRASKEARQAFEQEALAWCHLWYHPCIIRADCMFLILNLDNLPVLNLEYAPNGSLRDHLHKAHQPNKRIPLKTAFDWGQMIASALEAIHTPDPDHERPAPLIHCDLKPENVLLDEQGWTLITDLGLAKAYAQGGVVPVHMAALPAEISDQMTIVITPDQETRSRRYTPDQTMPEMGTRGAVQGTLPYMAPEQWRGMDAVVPATDIYAFGVLLFELFAGVDAYPHIPHRHSAKGWYDAHWQGPTHHLQDADVRALDKGPLSEVAEGVGGAKAYRVADQLDELIGQCLAQRPQDRPEARTIRQRLGEMATFLGYAPRVIPEVTPHTPRNESMFWNNLAMTYGNIGQTAEQLRLVAKAKDLDPDNPNKWYMYAVALAEAKQQEEALAMWDEAEKRLSQEWLTKYPGMDVGIANGRGSVYHEQRKFSDAVASYRQAVRLDPKHGSAWRNLTIALFDWAMQTAGADRVRLLREAQIANTETQNLMPDAQNVQHIETLIANALQEAERRMQAGDTTS